MTRKEAIAEARSFADKAITEARGIIRDAIEYRRTEPLRFALFHRHMAEHWSRLRKPARARWHRWWEARYSAKAWALDEVTASKCGLGTSAAA